MNDERLLEYPSPTRLTGLAANYIAIPASFIFDEEINVKDVATFVFARIGAGLNHKVNFCLSDLIEWCGHKPDAHSNGINKKFLDSIIKLQNKDYLSFKRVGKTMFYVTFNVDKAYEECQKKRFSIIYLDEIDKIMQYKGSDRDKYMNAPVLLFMFILLRCLIIRRANKLRHEERNVDGLNIKENDIARRREVSPEAYSDTFVHLSDISGIPPGTVAKAISVLEKLGLLVVNTSYNLRLANNRFRTQKLIFANAYKREGSFLLDDSSEYSLREIENKENLIQGYRW